MLIYVKPDHARITAKAHRRSPTPGSRIDIVYPDSSPDSTDGTVEEMIFRVQGYVVAMTLPPVTKALP